eukprot:3401874-Pleurochrysis_carterae.AAC.1
MKMNSKLKSSVCTCELLSTHISKVSKSKNTKTAPSSKLWCAMQLLRCTVAKVAFSQQSSVAEHSEHLYNEIQASTGSALLSARFACQLKLVFVIFPAKVSPRHCTLIVGAGAV